MFESLIFNPSEIHKMIEIVSLLNKHCPDSSLSEITQKLEKIQTFQLLSEKNFSTIKNIINKKNMKIQDLRQEIQIIETENKTITKEFLKLKQIPNQ